MTDSTKKKVHNVAVRVQDELYRSVKRTFADTDEGFQSLLVKLMTEYVEKLASSKNERSQEAPKRKASGR